MLLETIHDEIYIKGHLSLSAAVATQSSRLCFNITSVSYTSFSYQ